MKAKQAELLKLLLNSETSVSAFVLAKQLNVSSRTISNYVSEINAMDDDPVIFSSSEGYRVSSEKAIALLNEEKSQVPQSYMERARYIIRHILLSRDPSNIYDLCDRLFVSYSTLKTEIRKYNITFESFNIRFELKKNSILLLGDESDKRRLASYVLYEEASKNFIDLNLLKSLFGSENVDKINRMISDISDKFKLYITDYSSSMLLQHLLIALNWIGVSSGSKNYDLTLTEPDKKMLSYIAQRIKEDFAVALNPQEQIEFLLMIKTSANSALNRDGIDYDQIIGQDIIQVTRQIVSDVENNYLINLSNPSFITSFSLHLKNYKERSLINRYSKNPMLETIKRDCPFIYDIAVYIAFRLQNQYHFDPLTEDEISYLALHIGCEMERAKNEDSKISCVILCPEYLDLQQKIYRHLEYNHGHEIKIIDIISDPDELNDLDFSLLFTTVELNKNADYEICYIPPMMLKTSVSMVNDKIALLKTRRSKAAFLDTFDRYFNRDLFVCDQTIKNKQEAIELLCSLLEKNGCVQPDFKQLVLEREQMASTAFNYLALPHPINSDAIKTQVALIVSESGIDWDGSLVNIVMLPAITGLEKQYISEIYSVVLPIFGRKGIISQIRKYNTFDKFKNYLINAT